MKKGLKLFSLIVVLITFSSCAFHSGYMNNSASLSQANFDYVQMGVSGNVTTVKVFGIGGLGRYAIVDEAKHAMLKKHPLKRNETIVNTTVNWKVGYYLIVQTTTCTVTADIVRFQDKGSALQFEKGMGSSNSSDTGIPIDRADSTNAFSVKESKDSKTTQANKSEEVYIEKNVKENFEIGDKVRFSNGFKNITGVISKIDGVYYTVDYIDKKGEKRSRQMDYIWIKPVK